ncbi:hypothetical protein LOK49_LG02G00067 [Camellia lanceoleosa]|uniref:Uncharacterized protein n=1 Tax=Camellia lanceoleosa TaxID=1840588 RepID=A0ACC0IS03_9ERIC|nr:hypothetical protein LOK49_LG02G00067 [Camellia lanceoleosa]
MEMEMEMEMDLDLFPQHGFVGVDSIIDEDEDGDLGFAVFGGKLAVSEHGLLFSRAILPLGHVPSFSDACQENTSSPYLSHYVNTSLMSSPSQPRPTTHLTETETGQGTNAAISSITLSVAATETIGLKESTTSSAGPHQKILRSDPIETEEAVLRLPPVSFLKSKSLSK